MSELEDKILSIIQKKVDEGKDIEEATSEVLEQEYKKFESELIKFKKELMDDIE